MPVMCFSLPTGGEIYCQWPELISAEDLEMFTQVMAIQIKQIGRHVHRKAISQYAEAEYASWAEQPATTKEGEKP